MKRGTRLLLLLAVLAVAVGAYFAVGAAVKNGEEKQAEEAAQTNEEMLAAGAYDEIDAMEWTYGGVSVSLARDEDGTWYCPDEPDCPIDQSKVAIMQSAASAVAAELYVEDAETLSDYGLDEPQLALTVHAGDSERSYAVGDYSELAGRYYMTVDGGSDVYLEDGELTGSFWYDLENLVRLESTPTDIAQLTSLTVETDVQSYTLEYVDEPLTVSYTDSFHWFAVADGAYTALDTDETEALCNKAAQISFTACETWDADAAALAEYGLDEPQGRVTLTYETSDGESGSFALEFGDYADGGEIYVRLVGSSMVYRADGGVFDALMYASVSALAPENFLSLDGAEIATITLTADGLSHAVDTELDDVQAFLSDFSALYATGTPENEGRGEAFLTVEIAFKGGETLTASFYSYDSTSCLCDANGSLRLVSRTGAEALAESATALLQAR